MCAFERSEKGMEFKMKEEKIFEMCAELVKLQKQQYEMVKREIDGIINNKIINERYIERKLDEMLDILWFYENDETLLTFKKLCRYYYYINPQATADYIMFYKEQREPEEIYCDSEDKDTER